MGQRKKGRRKGGNEREERKIGEGRARERKKDSLDTVSVNCRWKRVLAVFQWPLLQLLLLDMFMKDMCMNANAHLADRDEKKKGRKKTGRGTETEREVEGGR